MERKEQSRAGGSEIEPQALRAEDNRPVFSLSELSRAIKRAVESFDIVRVRGEVSSYKVWSSGHAYFKLKDGDDILEAVIWKNTRPRIAFEPEDGLDVIATGRITTFSRQSRYQIVVEALEPAGEGVFLKRLEELKRRLSAEGLFDAAKKRPLPQVPRVIGVVTSLQGAVIRDILHRLEDRFPCHVLVWPVLVQGNTAAAEIVAAIGGFNALGESGEIPRPDVLVVARGGGSLEDLMPFNDEAVVRAVASSAIPVISAVGHETDTTLCDYAADLRAPTPTAAAELATPLLAALRHQQDDLLLRLNRRLDDLQGERADKLKAIVRALPDPEQKIQRCFQRLDVADARMAENVTGMIGGLATNMAVLAERLATPSAQVSDARARLGELLMRLQDGYNKADAARHRRFDEASQGLRAPSGVMDMLGHRLELAITRLEGWWARRSGDHGAALDRLSRLLESSSYQGVLARGFALVMDEKSGALLKSVTEAAPGQSVRLRFADGERKADITDGTDAPTSDPASDTAEDA